MFTMNCSEIMFGRDLNQKTKFTQYLRMFNDEIFYLL